LRRLASGGFVLLPLAPSRTEPPPIPHGRRSLVGSKAQARHRCLVARDRIRVVRLLHLRDPGRLFRQALLPGGQRDAGYLSSLALFGVGFSVRPFGALVFGRLGDMAGRKYTFLITIVVMGLSTALVGLLPTFTSIGFAAPIILVFLRLARASPWAASTGAPRSTSPSTRPRASAGSTRAGSRPPPPWGSSWPWS